MKLTVTHHTNKSAKRFAAGGAVNDPKRRKLGTANEYFDEPHDRSEDMPLELDPGQKWPGLKDQPVEPSEKGSEMFPHLKSKRLAPAEITKPYGKRKWSA